ncbi:MAG TPA: protein kinase [Euzebyales bacterium]
MPVQNAGPARAATVLARRYRVDARIAAGGMGTVHRGWDVRLDRAVAVKLLHPHLAEDDEVRARFHAEARHAARVRHPNVVAVLDADEHDDQPFIVMELVDGPSLREQLVRRARLSPAMLLDELTGVCAGLGAVHAVDLVHRDVKPENLLHDPEGRVRVADFGIARALDSTSLTPAGTLLGSVQYMAPEVVLGSAATAASDQYSVGIIAFEALTGETPLPAEVPMAVALRHAREQVPAPSAVLPAITPAVDHVVTTATARDPDDRFASLDALLTELRAAVGSTGTSDDAWPPRVRTAALRTPHTATGRRSAGPGRQPAPQRWDEAGGARQPVHHPDQHEPRAQPVAAHARRRARRRGAPAADDHRNPAGAAPAPAPLQRPIYVRARMSALALVALAFTLFEAGMIGAPLLGVLALRRIDRSHGALRGEAVAALAIVIGLLRLAGRVVAQA